METFLRSVAAVLAGTPRRRAAWLVVVAAVVAAAVAGGFGTAAAPPVDRVEPGHAVDVGPVRLAVHAWTIRSDIATSALERVEGAGGWLVVEAEVTAVTDATTRFPETALRLPPELRLDGPPEQVALLADGTIGPALQPGLPARVALLWPVADGVDPGAELAVDYVRSRLSDSNIYTSQVWRVDGVAAAVTLPRDDRVGDALAEEPEDDR